MDKICVERLHTGSRDTGETGYLVLQDVLWPPSSDRHTSNPRRRNDRLGLGEELRTLIYSIRVFWQRIARELSDRIASTRGWNVLILAHPWWHTYRTRMETSVFIQTAYETPMRPGHFYSLIDAGKLSSHYIWPLYRHVGDF